MNHDIFSRVENAMTQEAITSQEVDLYSPLDSAALPDDPAVLKQLLMQLVSMLRKETKRREEVERNMDLLLRKLTASRSTIPSPGQKPLFDTSELFEQPVAPAAAPAATSESKPRRKSRPHGRRKPPSHLEQTDVVHDLPAEVKQEIGESNLVPLPDVVTYQYDYRAAKLLVLRHVQKKYLVREEQNSSTPSEEAAAIPEMTSTEQVSAGDADRPQEPVCREELLSGLAASTSPTKILLGKKHLALPGCEAAPGLLAFIWLSKYGDHLPLYRLETISQRFGVKFSRSTTCDWMMELAEVLHPLWDLMVQEVLRSRVLHTDDTTVPLQDPVTGRISTARFWNYLDDQEQRLAVFEFTETHERKGPALFLANYHGYLQADAYNGYDGIYLDSGGRIIEVGCWQHARKRYKEAAKSDLRATCAMAFIKSMYEVERKLRQWCREEGKELSLDEQAAHILEVRQRESAPLVSSFREWIDKTLGNVLPKSPLGEAMGYTLNQWDALKQFLTSGLLDMDNNAAERAHRGIAIGRKNWMKVVGPRGGNAAAIHFSLIASCKLNEVEPFSYLVDVLNRLPTSPSTELAQLLPNRWKPQPPA
jgi:transposase